MIEADKQLLERLKDMSMCNMNVYEWSAFKILLRNEKYEKEHVVYQNDKIIN